MLFFHNIDNSRIINFSFLLFFILNLSSNCGAEQVKVYLDNTYTNYILADKQDCSVHKTENEVYTLGFKVGGILVGIGPEITVGEKTGIEWHHTIQELIVRYQELCTRFNTGNITKYDYERRLQEIELIEKENYKLHQIHLEKRSLSRQSFFDELDIEANAVKPK